MQGLSKISFITTVTLLCFLSVSPTFASTIVNFEANHDTNTVCINGTCTTGDRTMMAHDGHNHDEEEGEKTSEGEVSPSQDAIDDKKKELENKKTELEEKAKSFNLMSFIETKIKEFFSSFFS